MNPESFKALALVEPFFLYTIFVYLPTHSKELDACIWILAITASKDFHHLIVHLGRRPEQGRD